MLPSIPWSSRGSEGQSSTSTSSWRWHTLASISISILWLSSTAGAESINKKYVNSIPEGYDQIRDFCRRWHHQAVVMDKKLYVDGGYLLKQDDTRNYTNPYLSYHDLSTTRRGSNDLLVPPLITDKTSKPSSVPQVGGAALWPDPKGDRFILYGGRFMSTVPTPFELWQYNIKSNEWSALGLGATDVDGRKITQLYDGAFAASTEKRLGFFYGGFASMESEYDWRPTDRAEAMSGLIIYDMEKNTWRNRTGGIEDGRIEHSMVFVPAGKEGLLVVVGGVRAPGGWARKSQMWGMERIQIYDIAKDMWYEKTATGERIPEQRRKFCLGLASDAKTGLHNIYMYGGEGGGQSTQPFGYDEVWVLSLPNFVWVKLWPGAPTADTITDGDNPRHYASCNVINNSQMLLIGGRYLQDPGVSQCDAPDQAAVHVLDMGLAKGSVWAKSYDPNLSTYDTPATVLAAVDSASRAKPTGAGDEMSELFGQTPSSSTSSGGKSTGEPEKPDGSTEEGGGLSNTTKIVVAVAVPAVLLLVAATSFLCWRRRRALGRRGMPDIPPPLRDVASAEEGMKYTTLDADNGYTRGHSRNASYNSTMPAGTGGQLAPQPVAYVRDPVTGGLVPVYDHSVTHGQQPTVQRYAGSGRFTPAGSRRSPGGYDGTTVPRGEMAELETTSPIAFEMDAGRDGGIELKDVKDLKSPY